MVQVHLSEYIVIIHCLFNGCKHITPAGEIRSRELGKIRSRELGKIRSRELGKIRSRELGKTRYEADTFCYNWFKLIFE